MSTSDATRLPIYAEELDRKLTRRRRVVPATALTELDDEALLVRLQSSDREALSILFNRYSRLMLRIARSVLQNKEEAEDLVQDVFVFLFFKGKLFDPSKGSARAWLLQITYHRAYDRRRYLTSRLFYDQAKKSPIGGVLLPMAGDSPEEFLAWQSFLRPAFQELSEDQRKTLTLHFYEGYTLREISETQGQPFGNVQHHYYRGLDRLRRYVFHRGSDSTVLPHKRQNRQVQKPQSQKECLDR